MPFWIWTALDGFAAQVASQGCLSAAAAPKRSEGSDRRSWAKRSRAPETRNTKRDVKERERERDIYIYVYIYMHIYIYIYVYGIYIYIHGLYPHLGAASGSLEISPASDRHWQGPGKPCWANGLQRLRWSFQRRPHPVCPKSQVPESIAKSTTSAVAEQARLGSISQEAEAKHKGLAPRLKESSALLQVKVPPPELAFCSSFHLRLKLPRRLRIQDERLVQTSPRKFCEQAWQKPLSGEA